MPNDLPSPELLRKLLRYEPETGKLFWLPRSRDFFKADMFWKCWNTKHSGKEAFINTMAVGYKRGSLFGREYTAHRVIWAMHNNEWPPHEIDHINGDRTDNRIANLRSCTRLQNAKNKRFGRRSASGFKGVYKSGNHQRWYAQIRSNGKTKCLGSFRSPEAAYAAYCKASKELHGEFGSVG